jgi:type IV pilus assembly protein PilE
MPTRPQGVTLIELLIVVVIVAITASAAVPSYRRYVLRAHRVEAKTALLNLATAQEKFYLQNNGYAGQSALATAPPDGLGLTGATGNGWYTIAITAASTTAFSATATAAGAQTADGDCAIFTIDSLGVRGATNRDGAPSTACWN